MALGIASGTTPDKGLVTAVVAGVLISALGGSRVQIGGLPAIVAVMDRMGLTAEVEACADFDAAVARAKALTAS